MLYFNNKEFKYKLANKGKSECPTCGKKSFVLYIDTTTNQPISPECGKCDRADNCGYHFPPREYFKLHGITPQYQKQPPKAPPKPIGTIPSDMASELVADTQSNFTSWLHSLFPADIVENIISRRFLHTAKSPNGAVIFWQADIYNRIRTGHIMQYNATSGKRAKQGYCQDWAHTQLIKGGKLPEDFNMKQCLYGEHLLQHQPDAMALVVESEKTAILLDAIFPECVALATCGCGNLSANKCRVLSGRNVWLLPDNGKYQEWNAKIPLMGFCKNIEASTIMERYAQHKGDDIGDLITQWLTDGKGISEIRQQIARLLK